MSNSPPSSAAPAASTRVVLQPNRVALGARGEAANRVVRLVAAGGALKRNVRRKRESSERATSPAPQRTDASRASNKRQKTNTRQRKSASLRRSPLRKASRILEEESMGEAGLDALSDGSVGACEWASERSWSPSKASKSAESGRQAKTASAKAEEAIEAEPAEPEGASSPLPVEAVSEVHDYVWKHFQGNGDDERLEIIAEVGQVLLEDSEKYADKASMLAELADLESIIGGHEAVDEFINFLLSIRGSGVQNEKEGGGATGDAACTVEVDAGDAVRKDDAAGKTGKVTLVPRRGPSSVVPPPPPPPPSTSPATWSSTGSYQQGAVPPPPPPPPPPFEKARRSPTGWNRGQATGARSLTGNLTYNPSGSLSVVEKEKRMELERKRVLLQCTDNIRKLLSKLNDPGITEKQKRVYKVMIKRIKETMGSLDHKAAGGGQVEAERKVLLPPQLLQTHNLLPASTDAADNALKQPATPTAAAK